MKKTFTLDEVDCANCAAKMEQAVKDTEGVKNATLSFMTLKLKVAGVMHLFVVIYKLIKKIHLFLLNFII